jgi:anaerobic selenocysteine-containing dehydrogenase
MTENMALSRRELLAFGAAAAAATAGLAGIDIVSRTGNAGPGFDVGHTTGGLTTMPSMCQGCTTACGIIATVKDGRLIGVAGNPEDPNSRGSVCAKGVAGPSIVYDPHRLLYPMRRVGKRGEGKWMRITWEQAYSEIADRLRVIRESGRPEEFFFQQGRNRSTDAVDRFLNAFGTPSFFNHRGLCSLNRRAAVLATIGESDWDLGDYENSRYILNFGSNWAEAHQGHIPVATRMMNARRKGAKIVTFEARLSNTAALSDEWFCVKPGTDGLIALAMSNVICSEGLWDKAWFDRWSNYPADAYARHVAQYTPERAERESGIPAADIRRIAREFAAAKPYCTTICNRGTSAHRNGFYNDRAVTVLNALVGNMGHVGGWCWHNQSAWDKKQIPEPAPVAPKPAKKSLIAQAKDWPLANAWASNQMKVASIVYLWIKEKRQTCQALMTYNCDQAWAFPDTALIRDVLTDEDLIPFHVVIDVMYSDTAHLADIVLPWTTYLERWDIDSRPPQSLVDYVGLRQPVVAPRGQSKDIREIFPELARRIGAGMQTFYPWETVEDYLQAYFRPVPGGFAHMRAHGVWVDPAKKPRYLPHERVLTEAELAGSTVDGATGIVYRGTDPATGAPAAIGVVVDGVARRGFLTPSRKVEVHSPFIAEKGKAAKVEVNPLPIYDPIPAHQPDLAPDELIMISFKWNVHNAHRTGQSKWLQEIVHSNPAWINPATAAQLGLGEGDWVDVHGYRPADPAIPGGDGSPIGVLRTRVHLTEGVHPKVLAISHNVGRGHGGPVATNSTDPVEAPGYQPGDDPDTTRIWWAGSLSTAQNTIMPIYPDPTSGQQAYHDTIVKVRPL